MNLFYSINNIYLYDKMIMIFYIEHKKKLFKLYKYDFFFNFINIF